MTAEIPQQLGSIPTSIGALGGDAPVEGRYMMATLPIVPSNFVKFIGTPFQQFILPIIPPGAPLSKLSHLPPDDLGKTPGKYKPDQGVWVGFADWVQYHNYLTPTALERFHEWQVQSGRAMAIGLNT